jgi:hypothetical protein
VNALYQTLLHRDPTTAELKSNLNRLKTQDRLLIARSVLKGAEFRELQVQRLYNDILKRPGTDAEVSKWVNGKLDLQAISFRLLSSKEYRGAS